MRPLPFPDSDRLVMTRQVHPSWSQGGRLIAAGSAAGVAASLALTRVMQSLLFQVSPLDPAILTLSASVVAASALAAIWLPSPSVR